MPKIFVYNGYRFFFFSNEGNPLEPCHVHVRKGESLAKFWVGETVSLADNIGFSAKELSDLCKVANENKDKIKEAWNEFFKRNSKSK
ncbi:MAG: DUF4160 domain-containing protein [Treponema sp.]|nr:DUF4160 domain-containing protein [Treponema sp.]HAC32516.1 DUF4160 domain-containing protein [Treponema sp.]